MKLITRFTLATHNTSALYGLYRQVFNELANSQPHTHEHINALASLENIQREITSRVLRP